MEKIQPHIDQAQRYLLDARKYVLSRIPEDRNSQLVLAGGALTVASVVLYPVGAHYALGRQVTHTQLSAGARAASVEVKEIENLPSDLIENQKNYRIYHDKVVKFLPHFDVAISNKNEELFTKVLRRNMVNFSNTFQGYLLYFFAQESHHTFGKEYIESRDFQEGDLLCGCYRVIKRTPLKAELRIEPPRNIAHVSGLIIMNVRPRNTGAILTNETIQWTEKSNGLVLPLERWLYRFLHSWTTRSLVVKAAKYLDEHAY